MIRQYRLWRIIRLSARIAALDAILDDNPLRTAVMNYWPKRYSRALSRRLTATRRLVWRQNLVETARVR